MTINTKFNVGQSLYFINPDTMKMQCSEVHRIDAEIHANEIKVTYFMNIDGKFKIIKEDGLFTTREELLESL